MTLHYAPTTPEEEELALALALSASISSAANRLSSPASSSRPSAAAPSSSSASSSSGGAPRPPVRPTPPSIQTKNNSTHHRHSASTSPARSRWPTGSSAPVSPKASASTSAFKPSSSNASPSRAYPRGATQFQGPPSSSSRGAAHSPSRLARTQPFAPYPTPPLPPASGPAPRYPAVGPAGTSMAAPPGPAAPPVIPRSKSATGPNALLGAGGNNSGGGASSSKSSGGGGGRTSTSAGGGVVATAGPSAGLPVRPQAPAPQLFSDPDACAGCGRGFGVFHRTWITGMNRKWHPDCFKCGFCQEPLSDGHGSFSYQMHPSDPLPYHPDCYRHVHHPQCHVCASYIAANADGVISYRENGFWRERYCPTHAESDLKRCCACSRLQKHGEEWAPLPDDRPLCLQCLSSVVVDTPDAQPLYDEVLAFFRNEMRLPHQYKPPLLLVDGNTLNSHAAAEGRDDSGGAPVFHVRGLCVATMYSHIPSIMRGLDNTIRSVSTELFSRGGPSSSSSVHCHVKVLLLLYGLPRLLSGSIMAHELMHAWLRMEGVVGLPLKVEEGLCQLMACLWLDRQHEMLKGKSEEQRLASFFSYQIRTDTSEVYGEGFRQAMEAFQTYGLTAMIRNLKQRGRFAP